MNIECNLYQLEVGGTKNYDEIMKKCNEISTKIFELYDILEKN